MTSEASRQYIAKMLQLGTREELRAFVPATPLPDHLMYCIDRIESLDGKRIYEFLIEYHTKRPSEGIYYGCRGITIDGYKHSNQIDQFKKDWDIVKPVLTQQLDNNLHTYNAEGRYRLTDNADNNTYWLFWISLLESEDIRAVALKAIAIIRNVFKEYLLNPAEFASKSAMAAASLERKSQRQREQQCDVAPFTIESYNTFLCSQPNQVAQFVEAALRKGWIVENRDFGQYALRFVGCQNHCDNVDFAVMIHTFYKVVLGVERIPWGQIQQVFVDYYGTHFENIKGQIAQAQCDTLRFWKDAIESLYV